MNWNTNGNPEDGPENPWGQGRSSGRGRRGTGRRGGGGGGQPPDFEEWIEAAQQRLRAMFPSAGPGTAILVLLVGIGLIWGVSGFYRVLPEEEGVVMRFGAYHRTTAPGLHYRIPWPVERVYRPQVTIVNRIDIGMRILGEGVQINFRQPRDVPEESLMLTGDENIVDVDFSVFWVIKDAKSYLFNIQNPRGAAKAVAESVMREVIGKNDIQPILTEERQEIEERVRHLMQSTLDAYQAGIEIQQVKMQKVDPPSAVIDAFRDVQAARADQERVRNEAQAYSNRIIPEARGEAERLRREGEAYRERTIAEAEGEAQRFLSVYKEYRLASDVTRRRLFLETMERVFKSANKVIIDSGESSGVVPYLPLDQLRRGQEGGQR